MRIRNLAPLVLAVGLLWPALSASQALAGGTACPPGQVELGFNHDPAGSIDTSLAFDDTFIPYSGRPGEAVLGLPAQYRIMSVEAGYNGSQWDVTRAVHHVSNAYVYKTTTPFTRLTFCLRVANSPATRGGPPSTTSTSGPEHQGNGWTLTALSLTSVALIIAAIVLVRRARRHPPRS